MKRFGKKIAANNIGNNNHNKPEAAAISVSATSKVTKGKIEMVATNTIAPHKYHLVRLSR